MNRRTRFSSTSLVRPAGVFFPMAAAICAAVAGVASVVNAQATEPRSDSAGAAAPAPADFGFEDVRQRARELASQPFDDHAIHLEDWLKQFDYDDYREIEYRRDKALWHDADHPFRAMFFHRGGIFPNPVQHYVVRRGVAEPFKFDPDLFNYRALKIEGQVPEGLGFAGFKLLYPLNDPDRFDEVLSFLGSSYFRALGEGNTYGLSARGLAVNPSKFGHEEFPWFRAFWLEEPESSDPAIRLWALLDSQSVTGAYEFVVKPGNPTTLDVQCTLFTRKPIEELGIAPLTSMYLFGETDPYPAGVDFRPEVHDSDGLAIHFQSGERLWRPLHNPDKTAVTKFPAPGIRGFGLVQRDRNFENYQDLEAIYQARPTGWVQLLRGFGAGAVKLIEISHNSEANDSIVAYWTPARPIEANRELSFAYRLSFGGEVLDTHPGGCVVATRPSVGPGGGTRFVIDLAGPVLAELPPDAPVTAHVTADNGTVGPAVVHKNPFNNTWRLFFDVTRTGAEPVDLRAFLKHGNDVISETWSYRWGL